MAAATGPPQEPTATVAPHLRPVPKAALLALLTAQAVTDAKDLVLRNAIIVLCVWWTE